MKTGGDCAVSANNLQRNIHHLLKRAMFFESQSSNRLSFESRRFEIAAISI